MIWLVVEGGGNLPLWKRLEDSSIGMIFPFPAVSEKYSSHVPVSTNQWCIFRPVLTGPQDTPLHGPRDDAAKWEKRLSQLCVTMMDGCRGNVAIRSMAEVVRPKLWILSRRERTRNYALRTKEIIIADHSHVLGSFWKLQNMGLAGKCLRMPP